MKKIHKILIYCLCAVLVIGVGLTIGLTTKKRDYNTINISEVTHSIFYAPFYTAINKGYFKEEGLTINLTNGGGSDVCMTSLISGNSDIILAGPETVVYASQEGFKDQPKVFGQLTQTDGSFIVTRDPRITKENFDLSDLENETIIGGRAGGLPAMTLEYVIKQEYEIGTGTGKVNLRTDVAFNNISSAFYEDESVKFCTLFEPTATTFVEEHPEFKIVGSVADLLKGDTIPYTCFIAKSSYLKDHSDVAEKFLRAVRKAYLFLQECVTNNTLNLAADSLKGSFKEMTTEELQVAVKEYVGIDAWTNNPAMTETAFNKLIEVCTTAGKINGITDFSKVVDNTIANKIMAA